MDSFAKHLKKEKEEIKMNYKGAEHIYETKKSAPMVTVCVDFDGTMVEHRYPDIGEPVPDCIETLQYWIKEYNVGIILDTMRSDQYLKDAVKWCEEHDIPLYGIGKDPLQHTWTNSNKAYAAFSVDDRNIGCPLITFNTKRPYVNWKMVNAMFEPILKDIKMWK